MSKPDYQKMDLKALHKYVLEHRRDDEAFYAYVDRSRAAGRTIVVNAADPDWENKLDQDMRKRMLDSNDA